MTRLVEGEQGLQKRDRIGNYRGWVRLSAPSLTIEAPKPFGQVISPDPKSDGYYLVSLAAPARDIETGKEVLTIRERADNLRRIRYDRKILVQLIEEKGLTSGEYEHFWVTGEGQYFLTRPGYFSENRSGSLVTRESKHYFWWMDWDEKNKRMALINWDEEQPEPGWQDDPEYKRALQRLEKKSKKDVTLPHKT